MAGTRDCETAFPGLTAPAARRVPRPPGSRRHGQDRPRQTPVQPGDAERAAVPHRACRGRHPHPMPGPACLPVWQERDGWCHRHDPGPAISGSAARWQHWARPATAAGAGTSTSSPAPRAACSPLTRTSPPRRPASHPRTNRSTRADIDSTDHSLCPSKGKHILHPQSGTDRRVGTRVIKSSFG